MENILYLDDYINFYNKRNNLLLITKPYKNTLKNGKLIDKSKFLKKFKQLLEKNNLSNSLFSENLTIIINNLYSYEDKMLIKEVMENINYKNIKFIQELDYLKVSKNEIYINCNFDYYYLIYVNEYGKIKYNLYENDWINKTLLNKLVTLLNKKDVFLYGKNYQEISNILAKDKINYFYYECADNLIINKLLRNM